MIYLLYRLFKDKFTAYVDNDRTKLTHKNLAYWFNDLKGNNYYKFPDNMAMPVERLAALKMYYSWLAAGIAGDEMRTIIDTMKNALHSGLGNPDATAKIATLINVIEERMKYSFHLELYYNIIAVQAIRGDENPEVFNNDIQMQKVKDFKEMTMESGSYFFFREKLSGTPINLSSISEAEWINLVVESETWKIQLDAIQQWLNHRNVSQQKEKDSIA